MSIRTRIVLWFVALTALLLVAFSVTVYLRTRAARIDALDASLGERAAALAALIERDGRDYEAEFAEELIPSRELLGGMVGYQVLTWPGADVLVRADSLGDGEIPWYPGNVPLPRAGDLPEERPHEVHHRVSSVTLPGGEEVRAWAGVFVVREDVPPPELGPPMVGITVAEDLAGVRADLRALLATLAGVGLGMLLLSVIAGLFLARRIVAPLAHIAATAEQIQATGAARAVPVSGSGDEIDRLAATLNATFARLLDAYERQARFTADASHELRTPASVIRTQAEVALRRTRSTGEYQEALAAIVAGSERMGDTLEGLLLLARADAGAAEVVRERVDLREPVRAALQAETASAALKELALALDEDGPVEVEGDARQIEVAVRNLLSNAIRHSAEPGQVEVHLRADGGEAILEVRDHGEGIPGDQLQRIFERFYRVDEARNRAHGGAGLGLSIVREIAAQHGGTVVAESEPGAGTVMRVKLPKGP